LTLLALTLLALTLLALCAGFVTRFLIL
jgi:hypothetical protein